MGNLTRVFLCLVVAAGCGGDTPPPKKPVVEVEEPPPPPPKKETEEDRAAKRQEAAHEIVPEGSTCLPAALKEPNAPKLELAAIGKDAVLCATDTNPERLLGVVACWKVEDLAAGKLAYQEPRPLPGRSVPVKLEEGNCARGMCLPEGTKIPDDKIVQVSWNDDGSKAVIVAQDDVHIFDAATRDRETGFEIRGDQGVSNDPFAVHWVGETIFIEGADAGPASMVWAFKLDGTAVGPLMAIGRKPQILSTHGGSFVILDKERIGIAERGFSTITTYDVATGKRTRIVRKTRRGPCKKAEVEAYWTDGEVSEKCGAHMKKQFGHLIGADAVAGRTNLLVLLRGHRLGELAVLDVRNLKETASFKLPWCEGAVAEGGAGSDDE